MFRFRFGPSRFCIKSGGCRCQSGRAHIVYELGYLGLPCVLIPISRTSHNEQLLNAQILERNHQAVVLPESRLSPQALISSIKQAFRLKPEKLMLPTDASERIIQLIEQQFQ